MHFSLSHVHGDIIISARADWNSALESVHRVLDNRAQADLPTAIHQAQRVVEMAYSKLQNCETLVSSLENQLDLIGDRWQPTSPEYQEGNYTPSVSRGFG